MISHRIMSSALKKPRRGSAKAGPGHESPAEQSDLEAALDFQIRATGLLPPQREFRFHPTRKWRFDFVWEAQKLAVEVEGGTWSGGGRHVRGVGFAGDCEKYNAAALLGWRVLRFTGEMVNDGRALQAIEEALGC